MIEINLDESITNEKFWSQLFKLINCSYQIDYIKYKHKKYFNCSNMWNDAKIVIKKFKLLNIKPCHKDYECCGYFDCDSKRYNKKKVNLDEIEYVFSSQFDFEELFDYYDEKLLENINKIINQMNEMNEFNFEPKKIIFSSEKNIKIINENGFNDDHRGSDHTLLKLPFVSEVDLGKKFSLYDILVANFNLKSHKFDNWYELYCGTKCTQTYNSIIVSLDFDHGS